MTENSLSDQNQTRHSGDNNRDEFKRLTIDIPASLHRSIKSQCALRGSKITDEIREMLIEKYL